LIVSGRVGEGFTAAYHEWRSIGPRRHRTPKYRAGSPMARSDECAGCANFRIGNRGRRWL